jgi:sugar phosphate isomerase/epimerase
VINTHPPNAASMNSISRRDFVQGTALTALAIGCAPLTSRAASAGPRLRFGLVTYQWGKALDLPNLIAVCEKAGLPGVELRTQHAHEVEPNLSQAARAEVKKRFADSAVTLVGFGSNAEFHSADPATLKENIELAKQYVLLMHDCGGSGVKVKPNGFPQDVPRERTIEQIGKALNEVAAFGADHGQEIRVEVHGAGTAEIPVMKAIFDIADHPNAKICWNSNQEDLKGEGLVHNFNLLKGRFGQTTHVRVLDSKDYPFEQLLKLFKASDYQGWILLEAHTNPPERLVEALAGQRELFERMIG